MEILVAKDGSLENHTDSLVCCSRCIFVAFLALFCRRRAWVGFGGMETGDHSHHHRTGGDVGGGADFGGGGGAHGGASAC